MLMKLIALALLPAATLAADATSALECQNDYVQKSFGATWLTQDRCEALITFSKCLSAFPESKMMESKLMKDNAKDCEPFWRTDSSPEMKVRENDFQLTVDDAKDIKFFRHRREELSIFDMNEQIVNLTKLVSDLTTQLESVNSNVVNNVQNKLDAMKQDQDDAKKNMDDAMDNLKDGVASQVNDVKTLVTDSVSKLTSDTNKALQTQSTSVLSTVDTKLSTVDTKVKSLTASVSAVAVVAKAAKDGNSDKPVHMWSGGPRSGNRGNSWHDFTMDRVEYDTAAPYFKKESNTRFKALKSGLFKVDYNVRQHGNGHCWRYMNFYVDGNQLNYDHNHVESHFSVKYTATWYIKAGQLFWARYYVNCGNPYVIEASSNWKGTPSRVQVEYVGQLEGKCASNVGLCP